MNLRSSGHSAAVETTIGPGAPIRVLAVLFRKVAHRDRPGASRTLSDLSSLDGDALRALILAQQEELASRDTEINYLKLLTLKLKRMQYGRKSDKLDKQIVQLLPIPILPEV